MAKYYFISILLLVISFNSAAQYYESPDWIDNIPLHGELTAIGISDPRMENDSLALAQAVMRGKAMIAMLKEIDISYTSQYFQSESESHRTHKLSESIEKLGKYTSRLPYNETDFDTIRQYKNKNNETVVLLAYNDSNGEKTKVLNVFSEYYAKIFETSITRAYKLAEITHFTIRDSTPDNTIVHEFHWEADGTRVSSKSIIDTVTYTPPNYSYKYKNTGKPDDISIYGASRDLSHGLWAACFHAFLLTCSSDSKNYTSRIKNLDDKYSDAEEQSLNFSDASSQQEMSRQITKNRMHFYLHGCKVFQNMLYIQLSSPLLNQQPPQSAKPTSAGTSSSPDSTKPKRSFWDWLFGRNK